MPKKILLPTPDYPPQRGGVARYLYNLSQVLGDVVDVKYWPGNMPRGKALADEIRTLSESADEIWTSHIFPIGNVLRKIDKPYLVMLHGMDFDLARRNVIRSFIAKKILRGSKTVVTNSKALALEVEEFCGVAVVVVYPTLSDSFISSSEIAERKPYVKRRMIKLLTVARLVERKGHLKVLEVIKDIPSINYTIVGDGNFRPEIEAFVSRYGLSDRVQFLPKVTDQELVEIYKDSDIFVMPTTKTKHDREGFGTVYIEAGLFGVPSIAVNHPGVDEAVLNGVTGILINDDRNELKAAIFKLVDDNKLRQTMGATARKRALSEFTPEEQFGNLRRLVD